MEKGLRIETVTVVGANGTMGANVAGIFASFGRAKVYMVSRTKEKSRLAAERSAQSVRAHSIMANLVPVDYDSLEQCVAESDLVFESTAENLELKIQMTERIGKSLRPDAIACTGSSGLSITRLAACLPEEKRGHYFGVHMFNPPYQLTLCELTATRYSDKETYIALKNYLSSVLHRTVAESKDSPAFLGNRIGFCFMNEALQYAQRYADNGGIDYIDAILGPFTGRAMPPIMTSNFVGLDVHKAIVDNLYTNTDDFARDKFVLPRFVSDLISHKRLGLKSGEGFYKLLRNEAGAKRQLVYDIKTGIYRDVINYSFPFAIRMKKCLKEGEYGNAIKSLIDNHSQEADICLGFLLRYIVYALYTAEHVGYNLEVADDVMATGYSWCPPFALMDAFAGVTDLASLLKSRLDDAFLSHADIDHIVSEYRNSKYDYRPFFKAKD